MGFEWIFYIQTEPTCTDSIPIKTCFESTMIENVDILGAKKNQIINVKLCDISIKI